ncbi:DNA polymerase delta subunit POL32 [Lachancea thermotolerans CBS 6340]|uniref:KLTH0H14520p n=1 Tax=Lachancea thermotolerans (strain ATCC 56472 / CBS 6340 / NRRL Y-8284) TaxID=559295 RepID=C5E3L4_LACTC|nr:KLTH0H14520p [Lachancea thermotolerans CBS 6340]CAR30625.1 KLTH0H14520p [Lachancea thermotolerans CBS 6340]
MTFFKTRSAVWTLKIRQAARTNRMASEVSRYIHERLFDSVQVVLFTDVMAEFQLSSGRAKAEMYQFYRTTSSKVNCVIVCCYAGGVVKVVEELGTFERTDDLLDAFIYAFNPMQQFAPVNALARRPVGVANCFELRVEEPQVVASQAEESKPQQPRAAANRAHTVPQRAAPSAVKQKASGVTKTGGLRSTALLQKMRQEREERERARHEELQRRKQAREEQLANDPQRKREMEELASIFDSDEEEHTAGQQPSSEPPSDTRADSEPEPQPEPESQDRNTAAAAGREPISQAELGELLETTAEESLIETAPPPAAPVDAEPETYVDEEGYTVTRRPAQRASSTPSKRARSSPRAAAPASTPQQSKKRKQQSLMSFFSKRK